MSHSKAIGFVTRKAPGRGYELSRVLSLDGGEVKTEVICYRTTLPEIQTEEHRLKESLFEEMAWYPPQPQIAAQPQVSSVFPATQRPVETPPFDQEGMPAVVEQMATEQPQRHQNGGLMDRYGFNGVARAMMPALFLAACWASVNLPRLLSA